ncbi:MAG: peptidoglycan editing factor PgeF [Erythrobacter sp.]|jgi:YfiH family protein|nr:peptidoglycan editing factor PgeF [Erythrobacter sp.]
MGAGRRFDIAHSPALDQVPHGFFGAGQGGAHQFGFGGPGSPAAIATLRAEAAEALLPRARIVAPHQTHSTTVLTVTEPWPDAPTGRPEGDALVTREPGLALAIVTADCAPVLFADREAGVIGAAHAGWRGAQGGICENTVAAMEALGAERTRIAAAIGPTIAQASYEVDAPLRSQFTAMDEPHFAPAPLREGKERWLFDLPGYIAARLRAAGLARVDALALDTFALASRYHSYRRSMQRGGPDYGRQIALVALV